MSSIMVYHHLGLGDHMMCHGIVREYCKRYNRVGIFTLDRNYASVFFMFRDIKNLDVIRGSDVDAKKFIAEKTTDFPHFIYDSAVVLGFHNLDRNSGELLENQFYKIAQVNLSKKWDGFHVDRDLETEKKLYEKVAPKVPYVFLHEDTKRSYLIDRKLIDKKYQIFIPDPQLASDCFGFCTIIEKAAEIHVIDSSFMFMLDCLAYNALGQKLFVHRYSRENEDWKLPKLKKNWKIINAENWHVGFLKYLRRRLIEHKVRLSLKISPIVEKPIQIA